GLKQAEPQFSGESVLVLNGDTLVDLDLGALCTFHQQRDAVATLVLRKDPEAARWGLVEMDSDNRIVRITGRGRTDQVPTQPRMFAGIHVFRLRLLRDVPKGVASTIIDPYVAAIQRGETVLGYDCEGYWSDIGTPERYAQAEQDASAGRITLAARQRPA
ncbi:MAG TPA: NDP-sugar synthase, partial [Nitrospiraceae bacterium]|nr:NDP-sugar synthase [Nitrospiraceae bacterium]